MAGRLVKAPEGVGGRGRLEMGTKHHCICSRDDPHTGDDALTYVRDCKLGGTILFAVQCLRCGLMGPAMPTREEADTAWDNQRCVQGKEKA